MSHRRRKGIARNPPAVEVPRDKITEEMKCMFCQQGETKDILQSGKLYRMVIGRTVEYYHYFCCLFSTDGVQAGKDEEGLHGFLHKDLKLELKRGASIKCDFCQKTGATIRCKRKSCKKSYHFSCGALSQSGEYFFIFLGEMNSFCHQHGPRQTKTSHLSKDRMCMICFDTCGDTPGPGPGRLISPCCGRTYHRDCVQKTALQAGKAALKCPACNDKEAFNAEMERCGVYIPHADAQWEMPENSNFYQFDDMLDTHQRCDSLLCQCPDGPEFSRAGGRFEIIKCQTCGSRGVHVQCGNIDTRTRIFICSDCEPQTTESDTNSDDEDQLIQERLRLHDMIMKEKLEERDKLMREELERLEYTKSEHKRKFDEIQSIIRDLPSSAAVSSRWGGGGKKNVGPPLPRVVIVSGSSETISPVSAIPRKPQNSNITSVPDSDEDLQGLNQSSSQVKLPVILNVCGGREAQILKESATEDECIEIIDDSDSDIEVVEPKKKRGADYEEMEIEALLPFSLPAEESEDIPSK